MVCDPTLGVSCTAKQGETCYNYQVQVGCLKQIPFCSKLSRTYWSSFPTSPKCKEVLFVSWICTIFSSCFFLISLHFFCFIAAKYQSLVPTLPPIVTPPSELLVCKGVDDSNCPKSCAKGLMCDGSKCVPPRECPCVLPSGVMLPVSCLSSTAPV